MCLTVHPFYAKVYCSLELGHGEAETGCHAVLAALIAAECEIIIRPICAKTLIYAFEIRAAEVGDILQAEGIFAAVGIALH